MADIFNEFGKAFIPESFFGKPVRASLRSYLISAGFRDVPYHLFGILFFVTAILTYLLFIPFVYPLLAGMNAILVFFLAFILWAVIQGTIIAVVILIISFFINIKIYKRIKIIEMKMPDFLVLVSTNLKGGLSLEQSLWASIRPEFELLAEEMTIVSKRVMTGNDLDEALSSFVMKYPSPSIKRNMNLIIGEIKSGGKIVQVIDKVIQTMKKSKALKAEMAAATVSYMIFIGAVVVVIAPALFALAYQLLNIIIGFTQNLGSSLAGGAAGSSMPINFDVNIDVNHFKRFSVMALAIIGICSSMIISIIEKGDIRGGLKYIPAFTLVSIVLYIIFMAALGSVFGNII